MVDKIDPGDEIANVNFLCDDIVRALKYNTLLHKFRHRSFLQRRFNNFSEITQCNGHYAVRGHSRSPTFGTNRKLIYDFLLLINANLLHILHRFQLMADYFSNFT